MEKSHFSIPMGTWISPSNIGLLIIDVQNGLKDINSSPLECEKSQGLGRESIIYMKNRSKKVISNIGKLLTFFRKNNLAIIYTQIGHLYKDYSDSPTIHKKRFDELFDSKGKKIYLMPGSKIYGIIDEICPEKGEIILKKTTSDTFNGTQLDLILRNNNIDKLLICGMLTNCCVESTARTAFDLGYLPTVISDATLAADKSFHENSLRGLNTYYANIMKTNDIIDLLKASTEKPKRILNKDLI